MIGPVQPPPEPPSRVSPVNGLLVVLPTFNELGTLASVVSAIFEALPEAHVLIVDDASPDGTGALADSLAASDPRVTVQHRPGKLGLGTAYVAGFKIAAERGFRCVAEMDSDGSHQATELPALLAAVESGAGLAIGTRWMPGGRVENWPAYRRGISRSGTFIARWALKSELRDLTSGFRVFSHDWLAELNLDLLDSQGYAFQVETAWRLEQLGCPIAEVPITFIERTAGRSKMSLRIVWEALSNVLRWGAGVRRDSHHNASRIPPARSVQHPHTE